MLMIGYSGISAFEPFLMFDVQISNHLFILIEAIQQPVWRITAVRMGVGSGVQGGPWSPWIFIQY